MAACGIAADGGVRCHSRYFPCDLCVPLHGQALVTRNRAADTLSRNDERRETRDAIAPPPAPFASGLPCAGRRRRRCSRPAALRGSRPLPRPFDRIDARPTRPRRPPSAARRTLRLRTSVRSRAVRNPGDLQGQTPKGVPNGDKIPARNVIDRRRAWRRNCAFRSTVERRKRVVRESDLPAPGDRRNPRLPQGRFRRVRRRCRGAGRGRGVRAGTPPRRS